VPFSYAREVQGELVERRIRGEIEDTIIFCEHPPTLSLGRRVDSESPEYAVCDWEARGVEVVRAARGGEATYHGPGQLLLYPVISLRARGLGVKRFVEIGLRVISSALEEVCGLDTEAMLNPAGVWVGGPQRGYPGRKIGSVGLRIVSGVSSHGFSLNVLGGGEMSKYFNPCGLAGVELSSIGQELKSTRIPLGKLLFEISYRFADSLEKGSCA
jgi:lipoate-protein ligase B